MSKEQTSRFDFEPGVATADADGLYRGYFYDLDGMGVTEEEAIRQWLLGPQLGPMHPEWRHVDRLVDIAADLRRRLADAEADRDVYKAVVEGATLIDFKTIKRSIEVLLNGRFKVYDFDDKAIPGQPEGGFATIPEAFAWIKSEEKGE